MISDVECLFRYPLVMYLYDPIQVLCTIQPIQILEFLGRQTCFLGQQMGRAGAWVHGDQSGAWGTRVHGDQPGAKDHWRVPGIWV